MVCAGVVGSPRAELPKESRAVGLSLHHYCSWKLGSAPQHARSYLCNINFLFYTYVFISWCVIRPEGNVSAKGRAVAFP